MLEEDYQTIDKKKIDDLISRIFISDIDIEHIQSYHDADGEKREDIWTEWKEGINSIGNLMVLEQKINRSISNSPYHLKIKSYTSSSFLIVKRLSNVYLEWDLPRCMERKLRLIKY